MNNILIIEDDRDIQELLRYHLEKHGYHPESIDNGADALARLLPRRAAAAGASISHSPLPIPQLILLDLMLPGIDGLEICRALKTDPATSAIPIIMVTARGEEADIVSGLELGATDYICKPFRPREVMARVKAALRRADAPPSAPDSTASSAADDADAETLEHLTLRLDPSRHEASNSGAPIELTAGEFELLRFFMRKPGRVYTRDQIIDAVRGDDYAVTDRAVDVQIMGLRRKLGDSGRLIETVRGVGYRLKVDSL
jgi:Response regulators consisting of a CheY-like receiver domain and a winged-helix DNA-binding domain